MFGIETIQRILARRRTTNKDGYVERRLGGLVHWLDPHKGKTSALYSDEALYLSAAWRSVNVICNAIASLPWRVMEHQPDGTKIPSMTHPLRRVLNEKTDLYTNSHTFWMTALSHLLLHGNCYAEIVRDGNLQPRHLHLIQPERVRIKQMVGPGNEEIRQYEIQNETGQSGAYQALLNPSDILHVVGMSGNGKEGYSILDVAKYSLDAALALEDFASSYFSGALTPSAAITLPPEAKSSPERVKNLIRLYTRSKQGLTDHHVPFLLEEGMQYQQMSNNPENSQMLETRLFVIREICRWFGVPPFLAYASDEPLREEVEAQTLEFQKFTLMPIIKKFEAEVNAKMVVNPAQFSVRMDTNEFVSSDLKTRTAYYKEMRNMGVMTVNEIRDREGLPNIGPEGDFRVMQVQYQTIDKDTGSPHAPSEPTEAGDAGESGQAGPASDRDDEPVNQIMQEAG